MSPPPSILVTGCGGAASTGFIRSLREAPERFRIIGIDCDKYHLLRSEADESLLSPSANDPLYIDFLNYIIEEKGITLLFAQPDQEVFKISENRGKIKAKTFLPDHRTVEICQDKYESYLIWKRAGVRVPETILIKEESDIERAFKDLGSPLWVRARRGAFGKGSILCSTSGEVKVWVEMKRGWGEYLCARYLPGRMLTHQSIWYEGEMIVCQGRGREYWEFANRSPSGVTGITGCGWTVSEPALDEIAISAIKAVDPMPHGIFGVDCTCDGEGFPNPTEINIGRFFTTHHFFTRAGLNMPYIYVKLALTGTSPRLKKRINPLREGLAWIRGMDIQPILTDLDEIEKGEARLKETIESLKRLGTVSS